MSQGEQCLPSRVEAPPPGSALVAVAADAIGQVVQGPAGQRDRGGVVPQAIAGTTRGGSANLFVDRAPCRFCRNSMTGYAEQLGLDTLHVYGPQGLDGVYTRSAGKYVPV
ncbi:hypothetical protein ONA70_33490 [Micromonospora yasonensis]|uniref:hypothetical protein n=1 Tax=Micromonospora yasonensis TaxID=1128667 RepID=UPI0022324295|nr:hypothetical protein [Micromonospora yasonensis]MCW3844993.1 hypothetical protein [Micromonospora yasonensis]